jgi:hypothetical protein
LADIEDFADLIWNRIGAEGREHVRQSWELIEKLDPELWPAVYACFLSATWIRGGGRSQLPDGKRDYWDRV